MAETASPPPSQPSRYRSQRQQRHAPVEEEPAVPPIPSSPGAGDGELVRSKSRYHRKQAPAPTATTSPDTRPVTRDQHGDTPSRYRSKHRSPPVKPLYQEQAPRLQPTRTTSSDDNTKTRHVATPPAGLGAQDSRHFSSSGDERDSDADKRQHSRDTAPKSRHSDQRPPLPPPVPGSMPSPTGELFPRPMEVAEPPRRDGPPQSGQIRATNSMADLSHYSDEDRGCFGGLFKRKRGDMAAPAVEKQSHASLAASPKAHEPIRPGGGGVVPGIDAPKSAVNAGDRRVLVECHSSQRWFAVTPETTSVDIIKTAATVMSERIEVKSALLVETFKSVGVQRPLRRYEQIRDVLNSWDDDAQNKLTLVDPGAGTIEPELTIAGAPKERPEGDTWPLMCSTRPGKWEKRFVTLKPEGQIVSHKDAEKQKDMVNVCHLSDFDIYMPTAERKKGKIKPPKKHCFAIKSQQKTSMFESTQDFVHFFCTADPVTSDNFYKAVQSYRSWYLVHVRGIGQKEKPAVAVAPALPPLLSCDGNDRSTSAEYKTHRPQESVGSHYQLGSFRPLMDAEAFEQRRMSGGSEHGVVGSCNLANTSNQFDASVPLEKPSNTVKRSHPPGAMANRGVLAEDEPLANLGRSTSINKRRLSADQKRVDSSEFKDTGLLGRNYSQRRKENEQRETSQQAFTTGPNLLNGGLMGREDSFGNGDGLQSRPSTRKHASNGELKRTGSTRDHHRSGGHVREGSVELGRSGSRREKPKPLIDLTPEYKEPPQHKNKGKGHKPERIGNAGLIEAATSPEDPLNIPQGTVFRNTSGGQQSQRVTSGPQISALVDLTPQHKEPIHHARKGRGYVPESGGHPGGLVHSASTPEDPLNLPQNNVFRSAPEGRSISGGFSQAQTSQSLQRGPSLRKPQPEAFTGEGLLASAANRQGWGTSDKGRGVIDGSRAGGKPLVDINYDSNYAKGTLLNKVEKSQGGPVQAPIIDREKREEVDIKVGERL
ncbi:hypothetical protein CERZMDRAFT_101382 [Cercospora zeae-maydis SCOH1-5]|uniref:PH domain-containing protein n=1 Tax=Cercospora zeae-maydis SCOH1-5 TaxID=717836 RepID=A0A6A6F4F9_9PEZI|nr:hypothetical protein CERZMDRAFT_101382 [Cercospora zeae-maydis SCOH1-5]